jgi:hypothetical protein
MSNLTRQAEPVVEKLLQAEEDQLYEELGIRAKAMGQDPTVSGSFDPEVTYEAAQMGLKEDVLEFGQRLFRRWNAQAYELVCGAEAGQQQERSQLMNAFGVSDVAVAAVISSLLVSSVGLAPAIAAVVAALVVKRFFRPAYEEFCVTWKKSLESAE